VNSISGVLSNTLSRQVSGLFQKLFNDKSIKVNFNASLYSGSNLIDNIGNSGALNIDRSNVNFNIGKSFLNERLTFTFGSAVDFGLSPQQVQATKNLQFLPDISADLSFTAIHTITSPVPAPAKIVRVQASAIAATLNA
jgi:hypothetical protein